MIANWSISSAVEPCGEKTAVLLDVHRNLGLTLFQLTHFLSYSSCASEAQQASLL